MDGDWDDSTLEARECSSWSAHEPCALISIVREGVHSMRRCLCSVFARVSTTTKTQSSSNVIDGGLVEQASTKSTLAERHGGSDFDRVEPESTKRVRKHRSRTSSRRMGSGRRLVLLERTRLVRRHRSRML